MNRAEYDAAVREQQAVVEEWADMLSTIDATALRLERVAGPITLGGDAGDALTLLKLAHEKVGELYGGQVSILGRMRG